jgi:hypothetical protein
LSRAQFNAILVAGALLRLVALPGPGTGDLTVFKVWTSHAALHGVADMYGVGGPATEWHFLEWQGVEAAVVYPPLVIYELGAAGQAYRLYEHHHFPNTEALNAFVKLPALLAEVGLACLLFWFVRRTIGESTARWTVAAYWLNPAALINASVLGYLDAQFALPAVAAAIAAASGWPALSGALVAAAALTKPQGVLIGPAVVLALWTTGTIGERVRATALAIVAGFAVTALVVAPIALAGGFPNLMFAMSRLTHHDMVSANACNFWWIVGWFIRAWHSMAGMGAWAAFTAPAQILGISRMIEIGYPNPLLVGTTMTVTAIAWAMTVGFRSAIRNPRSSAIRSPESAMDVWLVAGVAAFAFHAYATLSAQVHENHLFGAVPLLVVAAAGRRAFRPVLAVVSAIAALNLNLFYGFGDGIGYALPRGLTIVDATVVLAVINCAALSWHAVILRRQCSTAGARPLSPAPA